MLLYAIFLFFYYFKKNCPLNSGRPTATNWHKITDGWLVGDAAQLKYRSYHNKDIVMKCMQ
jgi:hypothetical protein